MDIDALFKKPPPGGTRRARPPSPPGADAAHSDPQGPALKRRRPDDANSARSNTDDDERRYHGLSESQRHIAEIVDAGEELPDAIDFPRLKRMVLRFEKAATRNRELRVRFHPHEPLRYLESETDLAQEIKTMTTISSVPELYPNFVTLGSHISILTLLSHENTDIAIEAVALLDELTDDDAVALMSEDGAAGAKALVTALVDNDALALLVQNIRRLDENKSEEKEGIFKSLSVIENFITIDRTLVERAADSTGIIPYLLTRINTKTFDSIRQYCAELFAIFCQLSRRICQRACDLGSIDTLLRVLAPYRRRDPKEADETEMMENIFDALCLCLAVPQGKEKFVESEGLELMILMAKERLMSRSRAIKTIDHALQNAHTDALAIRFIEALGLKTLFSCFMKKHAKKYKKQYPGYSPREEDEHLVSIIASLFRALSSTDPTAAAGSLSSSSEPADGVEGAPTAPALLRAYRERLLFKLIEADFEKTDRLLTLLQEYSDRVCEFDEQYSARLQRAQEYRDMRRRRRRMQRHARGEDTGDTDDEQDDEDDDQIHPDEMLLDDPSIVYLDRLENGLFTLQLVAIILARSCYESYEIREYVKTRLDAMGIPPDHISEILKEYADNYGEKAEDSVSQSSKNDSSDADTSVRHKGHADKATDSRIVLEEERLFVRHLADAFMVPPAIDGKEVASHVDGGANE